MKNFLLAVCVSQVPRWAISLTPCFSGVLIDQGIMLNRFNGFLHAVWVSAEGRRNQSRPAQKPLKRLTVLQFLRNTPLKQGVNDRSNPRENLRCALATLLHGYTVTQQHG